MRCPKCGSRDDKVIDSRQSRDGSSIRRRRQCLKCKYRFTTYEEIERSDLRVVKRDRTHEPFDRRKLAASIAKAFEKRSTSRSEEHTSELQSRENLVCRLLLERRPDPRDLSSFPTRRSSDLAGRFEYSQAAAMSEMQISLYHVRRNRAIGSARRETRPNT